MEEVSGEKIEYAKVNGGVRQKLVALSVSFALAFVCITIGSKCSFLYKFNDWVDTNWYLTIGHGMVEGVVPYRDVFEQKGILLYALFALNYVIFGNTFWGIYILEIVCATAFLFISYGIFRLKLPFEKSILYLPVTAVLTYTAAGMMQSGGSVEEYCLPLLVFGLYVFLSYIKRGGDKISLWQAALCGLFAGCIFWMKFLTIAFYAVFAVIVFVDRCICRDVKSGFVYAAVFVIGFAVPTAGCLAYLGVNGAIDDMWQVYIYCNIFPYGGGLAERLSDLGGVALHFLQHSYLYAIAIMGAVYLYKNGSAEKRLRVYPIVIIAFMMVLMAFVGKSECYHYPIVIFISFGLDATFFYIKKLCRYAADKRCKRSGGSVENGTSVVKVGFYERLKIGLNVHTVALAAVAVVAIMLIFGNCTLALILDDYPQAIAAETIIQDAGTDDVTIINYKTGDNGFNTELDLPPQYYYYCLNGFSRESYPEIYEAQESYVKQGQPDYVITLRSAYEEDIEYFEQGGYEIIGEWTYKRVKFNYVLHERDYILLKNSRTADNV